MNKTSSLGFLVVSALIILVFILSYLHNEKVPPPLPFTPPVASEVPSYLHDYPCDDSKTKCD